MTAGIAALVAGLAAWLALGSPRGRWRRLAPPRVRNKRASAQRWIGAVVAGASGIGVSLLVGPVLGLAACAAVGTAWRLRRRARSRRRRDERRREVARAAEALGGLLQVGAIPSRAVGLAAADCPVLTEAAAQIAVGGDVVVALRRGAELPGGEGLGVLATAWRVAARSGASLSAAISAMGDELARQEEAAATVAVELSAARSAGRLMAALPLVGLLLGYVFGGDPIAFLSGSLPGQACLTGAVVLGCIGLSWTDALAERARS